MTRTPLRPLSRILQARANGENPKQIERENIKQRHYEMQRKDRNQSAWRLMMVLVFFVGMFGAIGFRMAQMSFSEPSEPTARAGTTTILAQRADIVDRQGRLLATNMDTNSLYVETEDIIDPRYAADELVKIFPDLDADKLYKRFTGKTKFMWLKKKLTPEQEQAINDIGEPGLRLGPREMRVYPNGKLAAHVMGGASFGVEAVNAAEVVGVAGVEKTMDAYLRDPHNLAKPLELSLDLSIQAALERQLYAGMLLFEAKGAAATLLDGKTGEVLALASLPNFDPNHRPAPLTKGDVSDSPLFNRSVQGVYELGSTFKPLTAAQAIDLGLVNANTVIKTAGPIRWGKHRIGDSHYVGPELSVAKVVIESSNVGTARIAQMIGAERQKEFMQKIGFLDPIHLEMVETSRSDPLYPKKNWSELSAMTISFGHGISVTQLHLAAAYTAFVNKGVMVRPTLLRQAGPATGTRVMSAQAADAVLDMMSRVVSEGTASLARESAYAIAGKTGTSEKRKKRGAGYDKDRTLTTFASVFPAQDPKYVLVVSLDEPVENSGDKPRRSAGWTAVPVATAIINRIAPMMGLRPVETSPISDIKMTSN